jgi:hypothetical protein
MLWRSYGSFNAASWWLAISFHYLDSFHSPSLMVLSPRVRSYGTAHSCTILSVPSNYAIRLIGFLTDQDLVRRLLLDC